MFHDIDAAVFAAAFGKIGLWRFGRWTYSLCSMPTHPKTSSAIAALASP
ncbi:MAG: hypothetical protein QG559_1167 [Campylobacterota bacterium]|nr:hypothetical protein [Campylobacterota bacterium]